MKTLEAILVLLAARISTCVPAFETTLVQLPKTIIKAMLKAFVLSLLVGVTVALVPNLST